MTRLDKLEQRLARAERRTRFLTLITLLLSAVLVVAAMKPQAEVIRARGVVITDAAGRDRLVLGAPMANVSGDLRLQQTVGLAIVDSVGNLNVAVGANNPLVLHGGQTGTRIAQSAGLTIYDPRNGFERGGMAAFADGRANMCLDYGTAGKEAACIAVAPGDQYAAVLLNGTPREAAFDRVAMFVGADGAASLKAFGGLEDRGGVMIRAGSGPASISVYDSTGKAIGDVADVVRR